LSASIISCGGLYAASNPLHELMLASKQAPITAHQQWATQSCEFVVSGLSIRFKKQSHPYICYLPPVIGSADLCEAPLTCQAAFCAHGLDVCVPTQVEGIVGMCSCVLICLSCGCLGIGRIPMIWYIRIPNPSFKCGGLVSKLVLGTRFLKCIQIWSRGQIWKPYLPIWARGWARGWDA
jgi:hypothetical protein